MRHKDFDQTQCPIARSLEQVGEWWTMMILRDAFHGLTRFDHFQKSLDIAPNMLTRRLEALVKTGLMAKRRYSDHPPRYEYLLTEKGRAFRPVLVALVAFGNRHLAPEGAAVVLADRKTGAQADPVVVDQVSGRPVDEPSFIFAPGPAATERVRIRMQLAAGEIGIDEYIEKLTALKKKHSRRRTRQELRI
jgi:DNA-binding HxlR family transcriptional regulator